MKKHLALTFCALVTAFALTACGGAPSSGSAPASEPASTASSVASQSEAEAVDYLSCTFEYTVPEGFEEVDGSSIGAAAMYQAEDGSNINVMINESDGSLASDVTEEAMVPALEDALSQQLGTDVTLENVAFSNEDIAGCPAYRLSYDITVNGTTISQTSIGLNGDKIYNIAFTDMTGSWAEAFEQTIASITAVPA